MPYTLRKVRGKNCYSVRNKRTKRAFSKCTTKEKAKKQLRLLRAIIYNKSFKPRKQTKKQTRKQRT